MFFSSNQFLAPLWHNGPTPGKFYDFPNKFDSFQDSVAGEISSVHRTSQPITTGTSVVGLKFNGGVIIAADTLVSYGSTAKFPGLDRVFNINKNTIIGAGGDYADFQFLKRYIDQKCIEDICYADNIELKPKSLYNWLTRILYNKRSKFEPLWLDVIVGGLEDGQPFLGHIDLRGKSYQADIVASGFGRHLALPYLRARLEGNPNLTLNDARKLIANAMEILFYRDCRAFNEYSVAICTSEGTSVKGPFEVSQNWIIADMVQGE